MMKYLIVIFFVFTFSFTEVASQQSAAKIKETREKTLKEIEYANTLLEETKGKAKESLNELNLVSLKLTKRREVLVGLELELSLMDEAITENEKEIARIGEEVEKIKMVYAAMIRSLYKSKSPGYLIIYLFASENISQFYKRIRTFKIYNNYLRKQKEKLEILRNDLLKRNEEIKKLRESKDVVVLRTKQEATHIQREVNQKNRLVAQLKKKQKEIEQEIKDKEKTARRLENELKKIIEEERRKIKASGSKSVMTPAEKIVSDDFEKNAGRLPWPTEKGIITGKYGAHQHPDYKQVIIKNEGIYIATTASQPVRSIFKGVVSRVFEIPGENFTVIIKHGQYYTLYHNLEKVTVKAGQRIETKESIGIVSTNESTRETILYFQVWKNTERRDPELWLAPL